MLVHVQVRVPPTVPAVIGEQDILGDRLIRPPQKRRPSERFIAEASTLAEGDLVHVTSNQVRMRFNLFLLSCVVLWAFWLRLVVVMW